MLAFLRRLFTRSPRADGLAPAAPSMPEATKETTMSLFKLDMSHLFSTVTADAETATLVFTKASGYVVVAEAVGKAWGLTGPQKLDAVKAMLMADLQQSAPEVAKFLTDNWPKVAGAISAMVAIFNFIGWAFQAAAPIIAVADPAAAPAIQAISAALQAAQALQQGASGQAKAA
jgi:hypothetical protein